MGLEKHIIDPAPPIYSVKTAQREGAGRISISHMAAEYRVFSQFRPMQVRAETRRALARQLTKPLGRHSKAFAFPVNHTQAENGGRKYKIC